MAGFSGLPVCIERHRRVKYNAQAERRLGMRKTMLRHIFLLLILTEVMVSKGN